MKTTMFTAIAMLSAAVVSGAARAQLRADLPLTASVRALKADVVIGEPIVLEFTLRNDGPASVSIPADLDYAGLTAAVSRNNGPVDHIRIEDPMVQLRKSIGPDRSLGASDAATERVIVDREPATGVLWFGDPGVYRIRVTAGGAYTSNEIVVNVRQPAGIDGAAYNALLAMDARIRALPAETVADRFARMGAIEQELGAFIERFDDSVYADYKRLELARSLRTEHTNVRPARLDEAADVLSEAAAHDDFVLQDQAMFELSRVLLDDGRIIDSNRAVERLLKAHPESPILRDALPARR